VIIVSIISHRQRRGVARQQRVGDVGGREGVVALPASDTTHTRRVSQPSKPTKVFVVHIMIIIVYGSQPMDLCARGRESCSKHTAAGNHQSHFNRRGRQTTSNQTAIARHEEEDTLSPIPEGAGVGQRRAAAHAFQAQHAGPGTHPRSRRGAQPRSKHGGD
jgi:hypothetical protein